MGIMRWYKMERWFYLHHMTPIAFLIKCGIRIIWGGVIPYQTKIGEGTVITYHGLGVVLNKSAVIGKNCRIRQHVTLASNSEGAPVLGDGVEVGAGAVIVGNIHIGDHVKIGALAFVNKDLPNNCTAVGVPAKPVKFDSFENEFQTGIK